MIIDINKELYIPTIKSLWLEVDSDGSIYQKRDNDEKSFISLKGKQLVLPLPEIVKSIGANQVCFHPLSENVARGDSNMIAMIKKLAMVNANRIAILLLERLMRIALKAIEEPNEIHLKGKQLELLTILPDVNKNTAAHLTAALSEIDLTSCPIVKLYNRRNGSIGESQYMRLAVMSFPMLEQINDPASSPIWSKKIYRKRDYRDYGALFDYLIPHWREPNYYSVGSDNTEAPSFIAIMSSYLKFMKRMNEVIETFEEHLTVEKEFHTDMTVESPLQNVVRYRGLIPPLEGNIGAVSGNKEVAQPTSSITANIDKWDPTNVPEVIENPPPQNNWHNPTSGNQNNGWVTPAAQPQGSDWSGWCGNSNNGNGHSVTVQSNNDPVGDWFRNTEQSNQNNGWGNNSGWGNTNQQSYTPGYQGPPVISPVGLNNQNNGWNNNGGWGNTNQGNSWNNQPQQNNGWGSNDQQQNNNGVVNPGGFRTR